MSKGSKDLSVAYGMQRRKNKIGSQPYDSSKLNKMADGGLITMKDGAISEAIRKQRAGVDRSEMEDQDIRDQNQEDNFSLDEDMKEYHGFDADNEDLNDRAEGYKQDIVGDIMKAMKAKRK